MDRKRARLHLLGLTWEIEKSVQGGVWLKVISVVESVQNVLLNLHIYRDGAVWRVHKYQSQVDDRVEYEDREKRETEPFRTL